MTLLRMQKFRLLMLSKSPSSGLAFGQAGLPMARGGANCLIVLKCELAI